MITFKIVHHDHKHGVKPYSVLEIFDGPRHAVNCIGRYNITQNEWIFITKHTSNAKQAKKGVVFAKENSFWKQEVYR